MRYIRASIIMKQIYKPGDTKHFSRLVTEADTAAFEGNTVHPVYATFALARDAEWCSRLFVLDMKEPHEEGIGTYVNLQHRSPALVGSYVMFEAVLEELNDTTVNCSIIARVGSRIIATGSTGQRVLPKNVIEQIFQKAEHAGEG